MTDPPPGSGRLLSGIMIAVGLWGAALAAGAFLFGYDPNSGEIRLAPSPWRGLIVLGSVAVFLGGWTLLVARRHWS